MSILSAMYQSIEGGRQLARLSQNQRLAAEMKSRSSSILDNIATHGNPIGSDNDTLRHLRRPPVSTRQPMQNTAEATSSFYRNDSRIYSSPNNLKDEPAGDGAPPSSIPTAPAVLPRPSAKTAIELLRYFTPDAHAAKPSSALDPAAGLPPEATTVTRTCGPSVIMTSMSTPSLYTPTPPPGRHPESRPTSASFSRSPATPADRTRDVYIGIDPSRTSRPTTASLVRPVQPPCEPIPALNDWSPTSMPLRLSSARLRTDAPQPPVESTPTPTPQKPTQGRTLGSSFQFRHRTMINSWMAQPPISPGSRPSSAASARATSTVPVGSARSFANASRTELTTDGIRSPPMRPPSAPSIPERYTPMATTQPEYIPTDEMDLDDVALADAMTAVALQCDGGDLSELELAGHLAAQQRLSLSPERLRASSPKQNYDIKQGYYSGRISGVGAGRVSPIGTLPPDPSRVVCGQSYGRAESPLVLLQWSWANARAREDVFIATYKRVAGASQMEAERIVAALHAIVQAFTKGQLSWGAVGDSPTISQRREDAIIDALEACGHCLGVSWHKKATAVWRCAFVNIRL